MQNGKPSNDAHHQQIIDEIERLRRELRERRGLRRAGRSVVLAYHALLERQYARLDDLTRTDLEGSINAP